MSSNHKSKAITSGYEKIHPAILSDSLDNLGISNQVMSIKMRPLDVSLVLLGRARTGAYMEVPYLTEGINPYELEITLVDGLKKKSRCNSCLWWIKTNCALGKFIINCCSF